MFCFPGKDNLYHLSLATLLYDDCLQNKIVVIQQEKTIQNNSRQKHFPRGRQVVSLDTRRSFCGILNKSRPWHIFPEAGQNCSAIKTKKIILNMKLPRNWIAVKKKVLTRTYDAVSDLMHNWSPQRPDFKSALRVVKMVLNTQCYQYLWLTMWFHAKKSKETVKKSKSLILQFKFGSRAQKWPKIAKKTDH